VVERRHAAGRGDTANRQPTHLLTQEDLKRSLCPLLTPATVIVCVGSELHGDDAAGVVIGRELANWAPWPVIQAGLAPESFVVKIANLRPNRVIVIDAADFAGPPGAVALINADCIADAAASTHGPNPTLFLEALRQMHSCDAILLGIQPLTTRTEDDLSSPVRQAVTRVVGAFCALAAARGPKHLKGTGPE